LFEVTIATSWDIGASNMTFLSCCPHCQHAKFLLNTLLLSIVFHDQSLQKKHAPKLAFGYFFLHTVNFGRLTTVNICCNALMTLLLRQPAGLGSGSGAAHLQPLRAKYQPPKVDH